MSCQDKDQVLILTRPKMGKGQSCEPCRIPQTEQFSPPFSSRQALPEARVHLRKCLSLAGLDMTIKHRQGRNFGLDCLTLSSCYVFLPPPKDMCQDLAIFTQTSQISTCSLHLEIQHFCEQKKTTYCLDRFTTSHAVIQAPQRDENCSKSQTNV